MLRRLSLRVRMVLVTAAIVTAVLSLGLVALSAVAESELIEDATDLRLGQAKELAGIAVAGGLPEVLPLMGNDEDVVQIVSAGQVLAASANVRTRSAFPIPEQAPGTTRVVEVDGLYADDASDEPSRYRVVGYGFDAPTGPATIFVAFSLEEIEEVVGVEARIGALGLPVLILVLSAAMWVVVGRTLAPVEAIRAQADAITGSALDRRVPEPPHPDEIGRLARTVNAMLGRLQDSAEQQRRFVADAAHELRSPVASMRAQLEVASDGGGEGDVTQLIPDLLDDTLRMQRLVDQLLLLARSDGAPHAPHRSVDLDDIVGAVAADDAHARGVTIDLSAVEAVQLIGDPILLEQMVRNLIENAVAHAEREVRIGLRETDRDATLVVSDDGPGIPVDRRGEVFHRFARLDTARDRAHGGYGLGLSIVAEVVRAHRGTIEVGAAETGGAEFEVRLPLDGRRSGVEERRK